MQRPAIYLNFNELYNACVEKRLQQLMNFMSFEINMKSRLQFEL